MTKPTMTKRTRKPSFAGSRRQAPGPTNSGVRKATKAGGTKVMPIRLEPALRLGLEMLRGVLKKPMNKLMNEAVSDFIEKRTAEVETDLEAVLKQVREYRKRDPRFREAIRLTAEAEAQASKEGVGDPAQGRTYLIQERKVGPAQSMVRDLLSR